MGYLQLASVHYWDVTLLCNSWFAAFARQGFSTRVLVLCPVCRGVHRCYTPEGAHQFSWHHRDLIRLLSPALHHTRPHTLSETGARSRQITSS